MLRQLAGFDASGGELCAGIAQSDTLRSLLLSQFLDGDELPVQLPRHFCGWIFDGLHRGMHGLQFLSFLQQLIRRARQAGF